MCTSINNISTAGCIQSSLLIKRGNELPNADEKYFDHIHNMVSVMLSSSFKAVGFQFIILAKNNYFNDVGKIVRIVLYCSLIHRLVLNNFRSFSWILYKAKRVNVSSSSVKRYIGKSAYQAFIAFVMILVIDSSI